MVKWTLCLTKHYAMKTNRVVDIWIHDFLISALVGVVSFTPWSL
jgi:hypothetical protein